MTFDRLLHLATSAPDDLVIVGSGALARDMRRYVARRGRISLDRVVGLPSADVPLGRSAYIVCATPTDDAVETLRHRGVPPERIERWHDVRAVLEPAVAAFAIERFGLSPLDDDERSQRPRGVGERSWSALSRATADLRAWHMSTADGAADDPDVAEVLSGAYLDLRRCIAASATGRQRRLLVPHPSPSTARDLIRDSALYLRPLDQAFANHAFHLTTLERRGAVTSRVPAAFLSLLLDECDVAAGDALAFLMPYMDVQEWLDCHLVTTDADGWLAALHDTGHYTPVDPVAGRTSAPSWEDVADAEWRSWDRPRQLAWYARCAARSVERGAVLCRRYESVGGAAADIGAVVAQLQWPAVPERIHPAPRETPVVTPRARFERPPAVVVWGAGPAAAALVPLLARLGIQTLACVEPHAIAAAPVHGVPALGRGEYVNRAALRHVPLVIAPDGDPVRSFDAGFARLAADSQYSDVRLLHPAFIARFGTFAFRRSSVVCGYPSTGNTIFSHIIHWLSSRLPAETEDATAVRGYAQLHGAFVHQFLSGAVGPVDASWSPSLFQAQLQRVDRLGRLTFDNVPLFHSLQAFVVGTHNPLQRDEVAWARDHQVRVLYPVRHPLETLTSLAQKVFFYESGLMPEPADRQRFRSSLAALRLADPEWLEREADALRIMMTQATAASGLTARYEDLLAEPRAGIRRIAEWMAIDVADDSIDAFWAENGLRPINRPGYDLHFNNPTVTKYPAVLAAGHWQRLRRLGYEELVQSLGYRVEIISGRDAAPASGDPAATLARRYHDWERRHGAYASRHVIADAYQLTLSASDAGMHATAAAVVDSDVGRRALGLLNA